MVKRPLRKLLQALYKSTKPSATSSFCFTRVTFVSVQRTIPRSQSPMFTYWLPHMHSIMSSPWPTVILFILNEIYDWRGRSGRPISAFGRENPNCMWIRPNASCHKLRTVTSQVTWPLGPWMWRGSIMTSEEWPNVKLLAFDLASRGRQLIEGMDRCVIFLRLARKAIARSILSIHTIIDTRIWSTFFFHIAGK